MNYATSYPQATVRCVCIFNPAEVHKNWVKFGNFGLLTRSPRAHPTARRSSSARCFFAAPAPHSRPAALYRPVASLPSCRLIALSPPHSVPSRPLWRAELSREGGTVRVVPKAACEGVQNRPPWTKPPSRYRITLPRRLRESVTGLSSRFGGRKCRGRVELFALCLKVLVGACRIALHGQNRPPGTRSPSPDEITLRRA